MFAVLESTERVAKASRAVKINRETLIASVTGMIEGGLKVPAWDSSHHFFDGGERTVAYFLVLDSINFCFWPAPGRERWEIEYGPRRVSGYNALASALKKAVNHGIPVTRAQYLAGLSLDGLKGILGGRGDLQLMEERLGILRELGGVLLDQYGGEARALVEAAGKSAVRLAGLLAESLSSFRDWAEYGGEEVFFLKRAQILAADLHGAFGGRGWGEFRDMDRITAFADYKVPQVLRHLGILVYAPDLARKVDQGVPLAAGGQEEVEIRANTIQAVEMIRQEMGRRGEERMAFEIDWMLWNLGQGDRFRERPYHRTVSIYY
jgi:hypothetical protein